MKQKDLLQAHDILIMITYAVWILYSMLFFDLPYKIISVMLVSIVVITLKLFEINAGIERLEYFVRR